MEDTATTYYVLDHLGSVRATFDTTGSSTRQQSYYAYGAEANGCTDLLLKFAGQQRDFDCDAFGGTDNMHAREYSAWFGRFLSVDRHLGNLLQPQSWNRYAYVLGNPANFVDPNGLAEKKPGEPMNPGDTCADGGHAEDGWCAPNDETYVHGNTPDWGIVPDYSNWDLSALERIGNFSAGFGDNLTFGGTAALRKFEENDAVNPCSAAYLAGNVAGLVWWTAAGGMVGDVVAGVGPAEKELGNITLTTAEYEARLAGLSEAEKLAELGGRSGAILQTLKNVGNPGWWAALAKTTVTTGPTPGGAAGLGGAAIGLGSMLTSGCL